MKLFPLVYLYVTYCMRLMQCAVARSSNGGGGWGVQLDGRKTPCALTNVGGDAGLVLVWSSHDI